VAAIIARLVCLITVAASGAAVVMGSGDAGSVVTRRATAIGPMRLVSPSFGYAVAYTTVERAGTAFTTIHLFVYDHGRWRNATPPRLDANAIDDVVFIDRRHGWAAAYRCGEAAVYLYRTSDGGRSWKSLGRPTSHSCGGGPTFLSFVDARRGWMEPVSPNGPGGELLRTDNGGRTWRRLGSRVGSRSLPCLAPVAFVSRSAGWMARCGAAVFATHDGGLDWNRAPIRGPSPADARNYDLPRFARRFGVVAATLGRSRATAVAFSVSESGGRDWSLRSLRPIAPCALRSKSNLVPSSLDFWPASVASTRVWWVVAGRRQTLVQVSRNAGHDWQTVAGRGLPNQSCAVTRVSAANRRVAWAVARDGRGHESALFQTRDGGRTWHRADLGA
jgi:photosystem II stability/assembly factor-like uncharacterized protein